AATAPTARAARAGALAFESLREVRAPAIAAGGDHAGVEEAAGTSAVHALQRPRAGGFARAPQFRAPGLAREAVDGIAGKVQRADELGQGARLARERGNCRDLVAGSPHERRRDVPEVPACARAQAVPIPLGDVSFDGKLRRGKLERAPEVTGPAAAASAKAGMEARGEAIVRRVS